MDIDDLHDTYMYEGMTVEDVIWCGDRCAWLFFDCDTLIDDIPP